MTGSATGTRPRGDWSRVWFALFFLCLAFSLAFAHLPAVVQGLRLAAIGFGIGAATVAWRGGGRGRAILLLVITLATMLFLPAPPVAPRGESRSVQWFFIGLGLVVLVVALLQALRAEKEQAPPRDEEPTGS